METNTVDLTDLNSQQISIAVVSDTHGAVDPRIVNKVAECTLAVHGGDIGSASVLSVLAPKSGLVMAVRGNNDTESKWDPSESDLLATLPVIQHIELPGGVLTVEHGDRVRDSRRYHEELRARHRASKLIVYGHTHRKVIDQDQDPWVINPGAAGRVRTQGGPSLLIVDIHHDDWTIRSHRFERT